jgi:glutaredoxin
MVIIYGTDHCFFCDAAKALCNSRNIKYEFRDVTEEENLVQLRESVPEFKTVPQIFWHGRHIGGYSELQLEIEQTISNYGDGVI